MFYFVDWCSLTFTKKFNTGIVSSFKFLRALLTLLLSGIQMFVSVQVSGVFISEIFFLAISHL